MRFHIKWGSSPCPRVLKIRKNYWTAIYLVADFTVKYNEGQTMGSASFLRTYVIAMLISKIVSTRNVNVRKNVTDCIIFASLSKVKQSHSVPMMLASKVKVAKSQAPVCQYQSSFILDIKASASKPGWRSIKQTSSAQLSRDLIAKSEINGALENWACLKLYIKLCSKLSYAHIVKWAQAGTRGAGWWEGAPQRAGRNVRLHSATAKLPMMTRVWWHGVLSHHLTIHQLSCFVTICTLLSEQAHWLTRKLHVPVRCDTIHHSSHFQSSPRLYRQRWRTF